MLPNSVIRKVHNTFGNNGRKFIFQIVRIRVCSDNVSRSRTANKLTNDFSDKNWERVYI